MNQIQLSDTQAVILSAACARDTGLVFPVTARIKGGAVGNSLKSLLKRGLIEELPARDPDTVWRHDDDAESRPEDQPPAAPAPDLARAVADGIALGGPHRQPTRGDRR